MKTMRVTPWFAALLLVSVAGMASPQGLSGPRKQSRPQASAATPVTHLEVNATLTKVEKALNALPGMSAVKPLKRPNKAGTASRTYIILELDRLFENAKPSFKFTPMKVRFDARALVAGAKDGSMQALRKLVAWGCVAKVGPLATGPGPTIGLRDFGDAIGFFVARISDLSHSPDPKYSPAMGGGLSGGGNGGGD